MEFYEIPTWRDYQHYKDRNPPWIKLHYETFNSLSWVAMNDASRVLFIACMLIASRHDGKVPADPEYVKRIAHLNQKPDFKPLIHNGFLVPASAMLADASTMHTNAIPETETETETEGEAEERAREGKPKQQKLPGTQRMPFKDRAAACGYWDFHRLYPEHRRIDPKRVLPLWEAAIKEEPELTRRTIMEYLAAMIDNGEYTKENGAYCPGMVKFFNEKKWLSKPVRTGKLEIKENHDPDDDKPFGRKIVC